MQKLSRTKIELSIECPRCFWMDQKASVKRPPPAPYTINSAIDWLFKQEFDEHRKKKTPHPIMERGGIDAVPFDHPAMDKWRHNFTGVQYEDKAHDFLLYGAVDDIWVTPQGELMVVDYKATGAAQHHIHDYYGRQMEFYQWLLRQNGFKVLERGYFVFARVNKGGGFSAAGGGSLPFDIFLEAYNGDAGWVPGAVQNAKAILEMAVPPAGAEDCEYCTYITGGAEFERMPAAHAPLAVQAIAPTPPPNTPPNTPGQKPAKKSKGKVGTTNGLFG